MLLQSRGSHASSRRNRATSSLAPVSLGPERTSQSVAEMKDSEVMDVVSTAVQLALGWRGRPRVPAHTGAPLHCKCQARVGAASVTLHLSVIITVISNRAATGDARWSRFQFRYRLHRTQMKDHPTLIPRRIYSRDSQLAQLPHPLCQYTPLSNYHPHIKNKTKLSPSPSFTAVSELQR